MDISDVIDATRRCVKECGFSCIGCPYEYTEDCYRAWQKDVIFYLEKLRNANVEPKSIFHGAQKNQKLEYCNITKCAILIKRSEETARRLLRAKAFPNAYCESRKKGWRIPYIDIENYLALKRNKKFA